MPVTQKPAITPMNAASTDSQISSVRTNARSICGACSTNPDRVRRGRTGALSAVVSDASTRVSAPSPRSRGGSIDPSRPMTPALRKATITFRRQHRRPNKKSGA